MSNSWTAQDIPDQTGRVAVVTGANSGIGFETAKALAAKSATVVMACRNLDKAHNAASKIRKEVPDARLEILELDLADLNRVHDFADAFKDKYDRLDLLINNAGVMVPPFDKTADGFELQFGANHLGHFALTGRLLEKLLATASSRIVTVSSTAHRMGEMDFTNLQAEKGYKPWEAYGRSKLANLLFTFELQRRLNDIGTDTVAVAAHPGGTKTNLQGNMFAPFRSVLNLVMQEPEMGALPTLYAATAPGVEGGDYYGPGGFQEIRGYPVKVDSTPASKDVGVARQLWLESEKLTKVSFEALGQETLAG